MSTSRRELASPARRVGVGTVDLSTAPRAPRPRSRRGGHHRRDGQERRVGRRHHPHRRRAQGRRAASRHQRTCRAPQAEIGYDVRPRSTSPRPPASGRRGKVEPVTPREGAVAKPGQGRRPRLPPAHQLAELVRTKKVSSIELTKLYLARLKKYDPALLCVVTLTEDLALKQAAEADKEIAAGKYRGPLHGIPWGAKDLIAYPGYKTTWGAGHFKDQTLDAKATVARAARRRRGGAGRQDDARRAGHGRPVVRRHDPQPVERQAGLERLVGRHRRRPSRPGWSASPSAARRSAASSRRAPRCGVTGLRPTFGRVSRARLHDPVLELDKLGPMARSRRGLRPRLRRDPRRRRQRRRPPSTARSTGPARSR